MSRVPDRPQTFSGLAKHRYTHTHTHTQTHTHTNSPGSDLAHLTAEMTCLPPRRLRVVMRRVDVSGMVLS